MGAPMPSMVVPGSTIKHAQQSMGSKDLAMATISALVSRILPYLSFYSDFLSVEHRVDV